VAERLDLRRDIEFGQTIEHAEWDERTSRWTLSGRTGPETRARHLVMASGALSAPALPDVPGRDLYHGPTYHTARWPEASPALAGKRVGVVGTGSSGVQVIPSLAPDVGELVVFQRTPPYVIPANNAPLDAALVRRVAANFPEHRARLMAGEFAGLADTILLEHLPPKQPRTMEVPERTRRDILEGRWAVGGFVLTQGFGDVMTDADANAYVSAFVRTKLRDSVADRTVGDRIVPTDYPIGAKRICIGSDYPAVFNRTNVELVDLRATPIRSVNASGIRTTARQFELDAIVWATGFDALTGAITRIDIRGRARRSLNELWASDGPQTYFGLMSAGFPNLYMITGPGSPGILGNVVTACEQHVDWVASLIRRVRDGGVTTVEAEPAAQRSWGERVRDAASQTLHSRAHNWWTKVVGGRRVFVPYITDLGTYGELWDDMSEDDYRGFRFA
jgi:cyclohexanone monooxygenase